MQDPNKLYEFFQCRHSLRLYLPDYLQGTGLAYKLTSIIARAAGLAAIKRAFNWFRLIL